MGGRGRGAENVESKSSTAPPPSLAHPRKIPGLGCTHRGIGLEVLIPNKVWGGVC